MADFISDQVDNAIDRAWNHIANRHFAGQDKLVTTKTGQQGISNKESFGQEGINVGSMNCKDCFNCKNCNRCVKCKHCKKCMNCVNCVSCIACTDCKNCSGISEKHGWKNIHVN